MSEASQEEHLQLLCELCPQLRVKEGTLCRESGRPCVGLWVPSLCGSNDRVRPADLWRVLLLEHSGSHSCLHLAVPTSSLPAIASRSILKHLVISVG